jgi:hypothetical protein
MPRGPLRARTRSSASARSQRERIRRSSGLVLLWRASQNRLVGDYHLLDLAGCLVGNDLIGRDQAADDSLPQPPCRVDHDVVPRSGQRVGGEQHPGSRSVHHLLHHDREADGIRIYPSARAIGQGPRRPQARPAPLHRPQHLLFAGDVEEGLLLTVEARTREVLGRRRGANRHRYLPASWSTPQIAAVAFRTANRHRAWCFPLRAERGVSPLDRRRHLRWRASAIEEPADLR